MSGLPILPAIFSRNARLRGHLLCAVALLAATTALSPAAARAQEYVFNGGVHRLANAMLATYGVVAIPNRSAQFLSIGRVGSDENTLRSILIGGGKNISEDSPLYLEGYLGFVRFDPSLTLNNGAQNIQVTAEWSGPAITGGVGWSFPLDNNWTFTPIVNLSYGKLGSSIKARPPLAANEIGADLDFLASGDLTAAGVGGSLLVEYKLREARREFDVTLRHTYLKIGSVGGSSGLDAEADVGATSAWVRARYPIQNWRLFDGPVRSVWQAGATSLSGDQVDAIGVDWFAMLGVGIELDSQETSIPALKRARIMLNYAFGGDFRGYTLGLGVSF